MSLLISPSTSKTPPLFNPSPAKKPKATHTPPVQANPMALMSIKTSCYRSFITFIISCTSFLSSWTSYNSFFHVSFPFFFLFPKAYINSNLTWWGIVASSNISPYSIWCLLVLVIPPMVVLKQKSQFTNFLSFRSFELFHYNAKSRFSPLGLNNAQWEIEACIKGLYWDSCWVRIVIMKLNNER